MTSDPEPAGPETGVATARMPRVVRTAQLLVFLEAAFALVGSVLVVGFAIASLGPGAVLPLLGILLMSAPAVASGWLAGKWASRRRLLRTAAFALEGVNVLIPLGASMIDRDFTPIFVLPLAVIVLLLLPSARAWFTKP
ncbi:hypothetical protein [Thermoactinospora rubra]|uniref:hypothetical protein n=1 Tax=Thermoactinospora rubra TaxID=1088767 RepID=UPI000A105F3F|nr:hypothetical protein [Thermoactinospora rubra]